MQNSQQVVEAFIDKYLEPVSVTISPQSDLGEIAVEDTSTTLTVKVRNNSSDSLQKIKLTIDPKQNVLTFAKNEEGGLVGSPGYGGTCGDELASHEECLFVLHFSNSRSGLYRIPVLLEYENLVKPAQYQFEVTALVGEAASLVFTNEISKYDLGVIEQTKPLVRELALEIQNVGGLNARDISYELLNDNNKDAFFVLENNCPKLLAPLERCSLKIGYVPKNNEYTDPETLYSSRLMISYIKDPMSRIGKLNGYYSFKASTIEAKFNSTYKAIEFSTLVAGNKESKTIRVTNNGYSVGVIKQLVIKDSSGTAMVVCQKSNSDSSVLACQGRADFPFVIEELTPCLEKEIKGTEGSIPGGSCTFRVTYWPKRYYLPGSQIDHDYDNSTISFVYDSRWLDKENIVTKDSMFFLRADFLANGRLTLVDATLEGAPLSASSVSALSDNLFELNYGRLAKVSDPSFQSAIQFKFKNIGENPLYLSQIYDGANPKHYASDIATDWNNYYRAVKHSGCDFVSPGATCTFSFSLVPLMQGNANLEDSLMYDDVSNILKKLKLFTFRYRDGSLFDDDGEAAVEKSFEVQLTAKLIAKGVLSLGQTSLTVPAQFAGLVTTQILNLKNIGTGDVYALAYDDIDNFIPKPTERNFPFRWKKLATIPAPASKDCYDILYPVGRPLLSEAPDVNKMLRPGESCALGMEVKDSDLSRFSNTEYSTSLNYTRIFSSRYNGTSDIRARKTQNFFGMLLRFKYWDGDVNTEDLTTVPSPVPFGYQQKTKDLSVALTLKTPPNFVLKEAYPTTSALIVRPSISAPLVNVTYPIVSTLTAYTVPKSFFESSYFTGLTHVFNASKNSSIHYNTLGLNYTDFVFHMGTFPVGKVSQGQFSLENVGNTSTREFVVVDELPSTPPITLTSFNSVVPPLPMMTLAKGLNPAVKFDFSPTAPGLYEHCFSFEYNDELGGTGAQRVCVLAEAVVAFPNIKVEYEDYAVTQNPVTGSVTETQTNVWNTVNAPLNSVDSTAAGLISFTSMRDSVTYDLKRIRFTNIGTIAASKFTYTYLTALNVPGTPIAEFKLNASTCTTGMTLAVGASCYVEYKYKPVTSTVASYSGFGGFVYETAAGKNQYVSQSFRFQALAQDPASVVMNQSGVSAASIINWSVPTPVTIPKSWPVNLGSYVDSTTTHMVLTTKPSSKVITDIPFKNTSVIKASFLSMNPTPGPGTWNSIYSDSNILIEGNRYCFYGDDENNSGIPAEEKGFNVNSVNVCMMRVTFSGDVTYQTCNTSTKVKTVIVGGRIQDNCNPYIYPLIYYSFKRSAQSKLYVHMKGFIEPNRSLSASNTYTDVSSVAVGTTGAVQFSWPEMSPQNPDFGSIIKYRVFYSQSYNDLKNNNLFYKFDASPTISYVDTPDASTRSLVITNLVQNRYYYFRAVALRRYPHAKWGNLDYVSVPVLSNLPVLTLPIPNSNTVYYHGKKRLIDKTYLTTSRGTRSGGATACGATKFTMSIQGTNRTVAKSLINSADWIFLSSNASYSTGYPANDIGVINHWLSDSSYNIKTSISLQDGTVLSGFPNYNPTTLRGVNSSLGLVYIKSCNTNSSCDTLFKMVGGDGADLFYKGTTYTYDSGVSGFYRCAATILCPTNVSKLITDATCPAI